MHACERLHYPVRTHRGDLQGLYDARSLATIQTKASVQPGLFLFRRRHDVEVPSDAGGRVRAERGGMHSSPTPTPRLVVAQRVTGARPERPMRPIAVHKHADLAHWAAFFVDGRA